MVLHLVASLHQFFGWKEELTVAVGKVVVEVEVAVAVEGVLRSYDVTKLSLVMLSNVLPYDDEMVEKTIGSVCFCRSDRVQHYGEEMISDHIA